jgi:hypothetical protein
MGEICSVDDGPVPALYAYESHQPNCAGLYKSFSPEAGQHRKAFPDVECEGKAKVEVAIEVIR